MRRHTYADLPYLDQLPWAKLAIDWSKMYNHRGRSKSEWLKNIVIFSHNFFIFGVEHTLLLEPRYNNGNMTSPLGQSQEYKTVDLFIYLFDRQLRVFHLKDGGKHFRSWISVSSRLDWIKAYK